MRRTALRDIHAESGARLIDFGGWEMPVQYESILEEVRCVRERAGLFDLGHMGRFHVVGPDAVALVDRVATNFCGKIPLGSIRYSLICTDEGHPIDDLLLYREERDVFVVVNASNADRDLAWMREHGAGLDAEVLDETEDLAMLAVQGPASPTTLQRVTQGCDVATLGYYKFSFGTVCGIPDVRISRTGYTGETGYELYFPNDEAPRVWGELLAAGEPDGVRPIGLGARDTLRLEAGMPLYGHEIDESHHPYEAGLAFGVSFHEDKGDWVGRSALAERKAEADSESGCPRKLVGFTTPGPRVPRQGHALYAGDEEVGAVCSGSVSPTLDTNIGTAYVASAHGETGTELELDVRGKRQPVVLCELPFYSRTRK